MNKSVQNHLENSVATAMAVITNSPVFEPRPLTLGVFISEVIRLIGPLENASDQKLVQVLVKRWLRDNRWTLSRWHTPTSIYKIWAYLPQRKKPANTPKADGHTAGSQPARLARQFENVDLTAVPDVIIVHIGNFESALIQAGAVANRDYHWPTLIDGAIKIAIASGYLAGKDVVLEDLEPSQ